MNAATTLQKAIKVVKIVTDIATGISVIGSFTQMGLAWKNAKQLKMEAINNDTIAFEAKTDPVDNTPAMAE